MDQICIVLGMQYGAAPMLNTCVGPSSGKSKHLIRPGTHCTEQVKLVRWPPLELNLESVINFLYFLLLMGRNGRSLSCVKYDDQSIGWPTEINFGYLHIKYKMGFRAVERFVFSKGGLHPRFVDMGIAAW